MKYRSTKYEWHSCESSVAEDIADFMGYMTSSFFTFKQLIKMTLTLQEPMNIIKRSHKRTQASP